MFRVNGLTRREKRGREKEWNNRARVRYRKKISIGKNPSLKRTQKGKRDSSEVLRMQKRRWRTDII